jgi:UrcA family protein
MKSLNRSLQIALAALAVGLPATTPLLAHAAVSDTLHKTVHYGDLNLERREGAVALYRQIESAAWEVCGAAVTPGTHYKAEAWRSCVTAAIRQAVSDVNRQELTAYYAERAGSVAAATIAGR